jgi:hypothetical protein
MCFAARLARQKIALGRHRFYCAKSGFDQCNASIVSQARLHLRIVVGRCDLFHASDDANTCRCDRTTGKTPVSHWLVRLRWRRDTPQTSRVSSKKRRGDRGLIASQVFVGTQEGLFGRLSARCGFGPPTRA